MMRCISAHATTSSSSSSSSRPRRCSNGGRTGARCSSSFATKSGYGCLQHHHRVVVVVRGGGGGEKREERAKLSVVRASGSSSSSSSKVVAGGGVDQSLNPRVANLNESKTVALTDLARTLKERGEDVIGLAAGEPDFDTPEVCANAGIKAIENGITKYSPNPGTLPLRKAICEKLKRENGVEYAPNEIVISNGAKQSVTQAVLTCCGPGDEVIVPAPYWVSYPEMVTLSGAEKVILKTDIKSNFLITPEQLEKAITPKSRMLILCSPSNPSGAVYSRETLEKICEIVTRHPRLLVLWDEIYEHIIYAPNEHVSAASFPNMRERTIVVNGFSKSFAMTGWRLGYSAAPEHFSKAFNMLQSQLTSGPSSIAQEAALAGYVELGDKGGAPVEAMRKKFEERRDYVMDRLRKIDGVEIETPGGAFYAFPDVTKLCGGEKGGFVEGFGPVKGSDEMCRYLLQEARVALVPGSAFGVDECIRISYAASDETLEKALDRITEALDPKKFKRSGSW
jgi:aspartate/glutamate/aspartate-prephenate aminotransferase